MRPSLLVSASRSRRAEAAVSLLRTHPSLTSRWSQQLSLHTLHCCALPPVRRPCPSSPLLLFHSPPQPHCLSLSFRISALPAMQRRSISSSSASASAPSAATPSSAPIAASSPAPDAAGSSQSSSSSSTSALPDSQSLWAYWTSESPAAPAYSLRWWRDQLLVLSVFAVTGSLSVWLVRPMLSSAFGVRGSLKDGPWSYRLLCVAVLMPAYSVMLVSIGTAVGRHAYFKRIAMRMWGRLLPSSWKQRLAARGSGAGGGGGSSGIEQLQQHKLKQ